MLFMLWALMPPGIRKAASEPRVVLPELIETEPIGASFEGNLLFFNLGGDFADDLKGASKSLNLLDCSLQHIQTLDLGSLFLGLFGLVH